MSRTALVVLGGVALLIVGSFFAQSLIGADVPTKKQPTPEELSRRVDHAQLCSFERTGRYRGSLIDLGLGPEFIVGAAEAGLDVDLHVSRGGRRYLVMVRGRDRFDFAFAERRERSLTGGSGESAADEC